MSLISHCPKCDQMVALPADVEAETPVVCPHCQAEFPLGETRERAVEAPELIVPSRVAEEEAGIVTAAASPLVDQEDEEVLVLTRDEWLEDEGHELSASDTVKGLPRVAADQEDKESGPFVIATDREEEPAAPGQRPRTTTRRRRKPKNPVREMIGAVVGGFLGLAIGYYILNYFWGPRFDILEVWLPGVPHTAKHWPGKTTAPERQSAAEEPKELTAAERALAARIQALNGQPTRTADVAQDPQEQPTASTAAVTPAQASAALKAALASYGCATCGATGTVTKTAFQGIREVNGERIEVEGKKQVTCPECKGKAKPTMNEQTFAQFSALAEHLARTEPADAAAFSSLRDETRRALRAVAQSDAQIGALAAKQLDQDADNAAGILVTGKVKAVHDAGTLPAIEVELPGVERTVTIVGENLDSVATDSRVALLGTVVREPAANLPGFVGDEAGAVRAVEMTSLSD